MLLHSVSQQWAGTLAGVDKEYYMQVLGKLPCKKKGQQIRPNLTYGNFLAR